MSRAVLVGFGAAVVTSSYAALYLPGTILPYLIDTSEPWMLTRLIIVFVLLGYGLFEMTRRRSSQWVLRAIGFGILGLTVWGLFSSELLGLSNFYILPVDLVIMIESAILALLLSLELPLHESAYRSNRAFDANYYHSWLLSDLPQSTTLTPAH